MAQASICFEAKARDVGICNVPTPGFVVAGEVDFQFINFLRQKFAPLVDASPERVFHFSYQAMPHMISASALSSVPLNALIRMFANTPSRTAPNSLILPYRLTAN